jgi:hypothetical protein
VMREGGWCNMERIGANHSSSHLIV